jgi:transcriptional regulator with XRE-family HTH domain
METAEQIQAFGCEIRRRRHGLGLTLDALGEAVDLTPNYIGSIEMGQRDPSISTITRLARGLDSTAGELRGLPDMTADAIEAARLLSAVPPEVREPIVGALQALARWAEGRAACSGS